MDEFKQSGQSGVTIPPHARLSINHCNLPAAVLGSLNYHLHPAPLYIDGVLDLHHLFFSALGSIADATERALHFRHYMKLSFLLNHPDEAGFQEKSRHSRRIRADYLRALRGWFFDANGREAAVLKSWVESRFGLLPRNHHGPLGDFSGDNYQHYLAARAEGLYNTNALESQLDLLYTFCQHELRRQYPKQSHLTLYRGVNRIQDHEILASPRPRHYIVVMNNLNSFTADRDRADEFGDYILETRLPLTKLVCTSDTLPGVLQGEEEYLAIGGVYAVVLKTL
ncbi:MAG: NAD(+)--dinitrogen-reductase ADP-D-ribosyltransferase [Gammaproteobacteria bacterium]|nr:NAD(+)--dinitrogen-reductase ADP-D-ribosyltransferase [Gammaproteobacteria bacterium]